MHSLMSFLNEEYRAHVDRLLAEHPHEQAMRLAVGGNWEPIAAVEQGVLRAAGMTSSSALLDVGCGSGRLAERLHGTHRGKYLGVDIVAALLDHAGALAPRFEFIETDGLTLPVGDGSFDYVSAFSVFTHLPMEATFLLMCEAYRVLRPGGRVVLSFLELAIDKHWPTFEACVSTIAVARHHNQFMHRDDLGFLAGRVGFSVDLVVGGDEHVVEIDGEYTRDDGEPVRSPARLGQSWMILTKPLH